MELIKVEEYDEDDVGIGKRAGLIDVCEWWIDKYPADIFVGKEEFTQLIAEIRENMEKLLEHKKHTRTEV